MKKPIYKWLCQLLLSSLLFFLAFKFIGRQGFEMLFLIIFFGPCASTGGAVLGDISYWKDERLHVSTVAVIVSLVVGFFSLAFPDLISSLLRIYPLPHYIWEILFFGPAIIFPVISYNAVTHWRRKRWSRKKENQQQ